MLIFRGGRPIAQPYPYDAVVDSTGVMLAKGQDGSQLVSTRVLEGLDTIPNNWEYGNTSPYRERNQDWGDLTLGLGLKLQDQFHDGKYHYAVGADLSTRHWMMGPQISTITPSPTVDSTNGIAGFWELNGVLYATNGRYALVRAGDLAANWTVSKDFSTFADPGTAVSAKVFYSNAAAVTKPYAFIALGDSHKACYFDGTTWTQFATFKAIDFSLVGQDFYRAHAINQLMKCAPSADPTNESNWLADYSIGDQNYPIVTLMNAPDGILYIAKQNGIYTLDEAGLDHELYPQLRSAPDAAAAQGFGSFLNDVYFRHNNGFYKIQSIGILSNQFNRLSTSGTLVEAGPEKSAMNDSPVRGQITAFRGHDTFHAYGGIYNQDTGNSYLLKYGAWGSNEQGADQRIEAWHGAISQVFSGKKITALHKSAIGAPSGHQRLYLGFSDGTIGWFVLPCVPNPAACADYLFSTTTSHVYLPLWNGTDKTDKKTMRAFSVVGYNLTNTSYAQIEYKADPSDTAYTQLGTNFTGTQQREDMPSNTTAVNADIDVILVNGATNTTPQVQAVVLHHAWRPDVVMEHVLTVIAEDGLTRRDGVPFQVGQARLKSVLKGVASAAGSVTIILPDETSISASGLQYGEGTFFEDHTRKIRQIVNLTAIEYKTNTIYGTHQRLMAYTHAVLGTYTHAQLQTL